MKLPDQAFHDLDALLPVVDDFAHDDHAFNENSLFRLQGNRGPEGSQRERSHTRKKGFISREREEVEIVGRAAREVAGYCW